MGLSLHRFCREGLGVGPGVASGPAVLLGQCESGWRGERRESQRLHFFHTHPGVAGSPWLLRWCALSPELQRTRLQLTVLGTIKSIALRLLGLQFPVPGVLLSAAPWRWEGSSWDGASAAELLETWVGGGRAGSPGPLIIMVTCSAWECPLLG